MRGLAQDPRVLGFIDCELLDIPGQNPPKKHGSDRRVGSAHKPQETPSPGFFLFYRRAPPLVKRWDLYRRFGRIAAGPKKDAFALVGPNWEKASEDRQLNLSHHRSRRRTEFGG